MLLVVGVALFLEYLLMPHKGLNHRAELGKLLLQILVDTSVGLNCLILLAIIDYFLNLAGIVTLGIHTGHRLRHSIAPGRHWDLAATVELR